MVEESIDRLGIRLIIIVFFFYNYVCECTVGVDVGDGTRRGTKHSFLNSIPSIIVMRCIVLERQMNVDFGMAACRNTTLFVGMDVRFCAMKIHDSMVLCIQTSISIVVHRAIIQLLFLVPLSQQHNVNLWRMVVMGCSVMVPIQK